MDTADIRVKATLHKDSKSFFRMTSCAPDKFMNLAVEGAPYSSFSIADMKCLRDQLIKLYPLDTKAFDPMTEYVVGPDASVVENKIVQRVERTNIAQFRTVADAEAFAAMKTTAA